MRQCKDCGKPLPEGSGDRRRYCPHCVDAHKARSNEIRNERRRAEREAERARRELPTLAELQRQARAAGLSYGQYMARRRNGN